MSKYHGQNAAPHKKIGGGKMKGSGSKKGC